MIQVDDAVDIILKSVKPLGSESVEILDSSGRVLYSDIVSHMNIPPFNNSAMDGYAVISSDSKGASKGSPVKLKIIDEIQAGKIDEKITAVHGAAVRIMTGAPMPENADSVIPVEDTSEENGNVLIYKELKKNENVRFAGEDIFNGQTVLKKGDMLSSADIGLLASLNYDKVDLFKRPSVALISTGDEIVDIGEELKTGQIRNSNAYTLLTEIKKYNGIASYLGIAKDTLEDTKEKFIKGLQHNIVITTGGVSMGKYDFVKDVMLELDVKIKIEKIKMKPGKPMAFGTKGDTLFFGLPGNPVSALNSFIQFVRPAMLKMMGATKINKPLVEAVLEDEIRKKPGRRHFIRGFFTIENGSFHVSTTGPQGSGILRSMSEANCLVIVPTGVEYIEKGEKVRIQLIMHDEV